MAFEVVAASYQERAAKSPPTRLVVTTGLLMGGVCVFAAAVGVLQMFHGRWIIEQTVTLGHMLLAMAAFSCGLVVARRASERGMGMLAVQALASGALAGVLPWLLVLAVHEFNLRRVFVALSKPLAKIITFGADPALAGVILVAGGALLALLGLLLCLVTPRVRRPLVTGLAFAGAVGLFQELIQLMLPLEGALGEVRKTLFTYDGLRPQGALIVFAVVAAVMALWDAQKHHVMEPYEALPRARQAQVRMVLIGAGLLVLFAFPLVAGNFIGQVLMFVGLYILMGMGLNLELGLAGLLDLGFVAFFAVGAYTTALLTADSAYRLFEEPWSYWQALPMAVLLSLVVGLLFGVPVLKVRGDYLAVATLGLGEIVRVLVVSDMAAPLLGGAQGLLHIPRPVLFGFELANPVSLFYLTLACSGVVAYFAWRLENSRLGRAWTAIRDDEDVAQALGINLVNVKLLAYGLGAAFAGVAGSIFAVMLGSIFPHSFQLLISVNVLALLIVGGMGSLPGVAVGALMLIGLPELLREFGEYRFLFYGLAIVVMMRLRPAGLWPSAARRREMRGVEEDRVAIAAELGGSPKP